MAADKPKSDSSAEEPGSSEQVEGQADSPALSGGESAQPAGTPGKPAAKSKLAAARAAKPGGAASSKLAAARASGASASKPAEAAQSSAAAVTPAKPGPKRPAEGPKPPKPASTEPGRRSFITWVAVGWVAFTAACSAMLLGSARFMFPNWLREPPSKFKIGSPDDYSPESVSTKWVPQFGIWVVNTLYRGQRQIYALRTVCTHLGCTPNWLEAEQKFKCPCHGSGFRISGMNFEGPAPRPLERYAIRLADDGQLEVDKSQLFQEEMGGWANADSFVTV